MELNSAADGIYLVPELEGIAGLPEIRTTSGVNAGYDGGWTSAQNYDARLIAIRGVIASRDVAQVEAQRRKLASLLGQGRKEQLTLHFTTEAGNSYAINVRTISCEMALQRVLNKQDFLIQLRADDPLIYDDGTSGGIEAILRVRQALGGFQINFNLPLEISGGSETTDVENGQETVYPIISLYGPLHSPTVVNMTTNQQMQVIADLGYTISWSGLVNASGEYFSITNNLDKEAPMSLARIYGNTTQQTYTGKNKLAPTASFSETHNGITFTGDGAGKYTISGTATAGSNSAQMTVAEYTIQSDDYLHIMNSTASTTCAFVLAFSDATTASPTLSPANRILSLASYVGKTVTKVYLYTSGSTVATTPITLTPMIVNSATATDYEPYVGGQPSPSPTFPQTIETVTGRQTVEVRGKNLFDPANLYHGYYDPGAPSTLVANESYRTAIINNLPAGTYTFSCSLAQCYLLRWAINGTSTAINGTISPFTFTTSSAGTFRICFRTEPIAVITASFNTMVESGSTATAYEPYNGQDYEVNLGKNLVTLADGVETSNGITSTTNGSTISYSGTPSSTWAFMTREYSFSERLPVGTYTFSIGEASSTNGFLIALYDADRTQTTYTIPMGAESVTFTTTKESIAYKFALSGLTVGTATNSSVSNLQLEKGSTATAYAPYFTPIELCKIGTYQDRIYKEGGKWYVEKQLGKVVLTGSASETWAYNASYSGFRYTNTDFNVSSANPSNDLICSHFTVATERGALPTAPIIKTYNSTSDSTYAFFCDGTSDLAVFKTWLSTHPTTVYYPLATPTTTEITNEALVAELEAAVGTLGIGENNVFSITPGGNATPTLTISYATRYTEQRDTIVIDSQARTVTLNGVDAYHLKTDESEFPVLASGTNEMYLTSAITSDSGYAEVKFKQGHLSI